MMAHPIPNATLTLLLALFVSAACLVPAAAAQDSESLDPSKPYMAFLLGYSFGLANSPFSDLTSVGAASGTDAEGNEPLVAAVATIGGHSGFRLDLKLAMASFGRLVDITGGNGTASPEDTALSSMADVRRSLLADLTFRWRISRLGSTDGSLALYLGSNIGFLFDVQGKEENQSLPDASSYVLLGPSFRADVGQGSTLLLDLFAGQSEVMTNQELFSGTWKFRETRIRPRIRLTFNDQDRIEGSSETDNDKSGFFDRPFVIGLWGDLGLDDEHGDTYALFISTTIESYGTKR